MQNNDALFIQENANLVAFYRQNPIIAAKDLLNVRLPIPQRRILTDFWFRSFVLVSAGRGSGKCVTGDTLVFTESGIFPIKELGSELDPLSDIDLVVEGFDGKTKATKWYYDGVQRVNNIKTSYGYGISGTDDHRVKVLELGGNINWKCLADVVVGDFVALSRSNTVWPAQDKLTADEAAMLGLLVGDGCFRGNKYYLSFTNEDQELLDFFYTTALATFGVAPQRYSSSSGCPELRLTRKSVWDKLENWGVENNVLSGSKAVPSAVMESSKSVIAAFLRGLFDADGGRDCEGNSAVSYCTKSPTLANQVHQLLLNFGVVARVRGKIVKGKTYFVVDITTHNVDIYAEEIGFISTRKAKELAGIVGWKRNPNLDVIPGLSEVFYQMWDRTRGALTCTQRERMKRYKYGKENPSYAGILKQIKVYPFDDELKNRLIHLYEKHYLYAEVVSKETSYEKVYDLVVPDGNSFVANGFINHNTFINAVFACLWALLYPGQRIGLLAPSFRQSKMVFAEVEKIWGMAPILQEATDRRPIRQSDRCLLTFRQAGNKPASVIESAPLGDGCLCNHSLISLSDRFCTMGNLFQNGGTGPRKLFKEECSIWSNGEFRISDERHYNGIKKTKKIKTRKGYAIEGTLNHKIKVLRDGVVRWAEFDAISEGDRVLIDRSFRWHTAPEEVPLTDAYALGLLIGDGCWTLKNGISFASGDPELAKAVQEAFSVQFKANPDGQHWYFYNKQEKHKWLDFWGLKNYTYTKNKCLPPKILSASREAMAACISGLYDSDGHLQIGRKDGGTGITVGFTNTSEVLVDQLHYILLHFGIVAYKTYRDRDEKWNRVYELLITGENVKRFAECIGFRLKRKSDMLWSAIAEKKLWVSTTDSVPGVLDEMVAFRKAHRLKKGTGTKDAFHIRASALEDRKEASRRDVSCFLDIYSHLEHPLLDKLALLADDSVYYDEVVEISEGRAPTYDIHVPDGHEYCASGFYSHNSKIRGSRFYVIIADEFAQIPVEIFNTVILPMGATVANPMENVERVAYKKRLIERGLATEEDMQESSNKIFMTSSAFYQFNHMYESLLSYDQNIKDGDERYAVHRVSYRDMPEGFLDKDNITNAKSRLSRTEFRMEYEAIWEADSAGVFKASLIEKCKSTERTVMVRGNSSKEYVLGVDPARTSDAFALCVIEIGNPSSIVAVWEYYRKDFPTMAKIVIDICSAFNIIAVQMDAGGGGLAIKDLLAEEGRFDASQRILDIDDEETLGLAGRRMLHMVNFNPRWISEAVYGSLNLLEKGGLVFPRRPRPSADTEAAYNKLDDEEGLYEAVERMVRQLLLIEATESRSGIAHFDVPSGGGHASQKKDLYTAFILAGKMVYDLTTSREEVAGIIELGLVESRPLFVSPPDRDVSGPDHSSIWGNRKLFKPGR